MKLLMREKFMTLGKDHLVVSLLMISLFIASLAPGRAYARVSAGQSTDRPGFTYSGSTEDVLDGDTYFYVENDLAISTVSSRIGANNEAGTFQKGCVADVVLKAKNVETLDWTQFIIAESILDGWDYPDLNVALDTITVQDNRRVIASGCWLPDPAIEVEATYEMLDDAPIMKIVVEVTNAGQTDFAGFLQYQVDPDGSGNQNAYVPGLGWAPGLVSSGWSENYIYDGPTGDSTLPAHGIAWYTDNPAAIHAPGYVFGVWFDISVASGGGKTITFYHITDVSLVTRRPYARIAEWAQMIAALDPVTSSLGIIRGRITDVETQEGIAAVTVVARGVDGQVKGLTNTNTDGDYALRLDPDAYVLSVSSLGYDCVSRSVDMTEGPTTYTENVALVPISVWAGTGKMLLGSLAEGTEADVVIENRNLAMSIAVTKEDAQLAPSTKGKPLDLAARGLTDGIDWLNLPYISLAQPQGADAWQITTVVNHTVEVIENTDQRAVVKATGTYSEIRGVRVVTLYTVEPNQPWIYAETQITNPSSQDLQLWVGDAIDNDESGQTSHVPGRGDINEAYRDPIVVTPDMPWIAQYGQSDQCYGLIYQGDYVDFTAYGTTGWIQSQKRVLIPSRKTYVLARYIVAVPADGPGPKPLAVEDIFYEVSGQEAGVNITLSLEDARVSAGEQTRAVLQLHNSSAEVRQGYRAVLNLPESLSTEDPLDVAVGSIAPGTSSQVSWRLTALTGGLASVSVTVDKPNQYPRTRTAELFISGPGWYGGDNHTHSIWSDGRGTVAQNVASAKQKGLSFLTCTDHNTINQRNDAEAQNSPDFVVLFGEEVSSSYGHSLAYDISSLIDWRLPPQQMIDSANASNQGRGFLYIAHPYYPNLEWDHLEVVGFVGFEVWNGFYDPRHPVNSQSFDLWDQFNLQGRHLYGMANSDAHNVNKIGDPHIRVYLNELTREEVLAAMQNGTYYGTNGPELSFTIDDLMMGSDISVGRGGRDVSIRLGGVYSQPLTSMQLIKNGVVLETWTPNAQSVTETVIDHAMPGDFYRVVVENQTAYAFSNPIWIVE